MLSTVQFKCPSILKLADITPIHKMGKKDLKAYCQIYPKSLKSVCSPKCLTFLRIFLLNINAVSENALTRSNVS